MLIQEHLSYSIKMVMYKHRPVWCRHLIIPVRHLPKE